jgi:hypothetical protein
VNPEDDPGFFQNPRLFLEVGPGQRALVQPFLGEIDFQFVAFRVEPETR